MKKRITKLRAILVILFVLGLSNCQLGQEHGWSRTGVLRGNVFLDIEFPLSVLVPNDVEIRGPTREGVSVSTERRVSRSVVPINSSTPIRRAIIPDDLWQALLALQQEWCQHPPPASYPTYGPDRYEIVIKCDWYTPVYSLAPSDIPTPLTQLMEFIP